jgi:hypothetical protein
MNFKNLMLLLKPQKRNYRKAPVRKIRGYCVLVPQNVGRCSTDERLKSRAYTPLYTTDSAELVL